MARRADSRAYSRTTSETPRSMPTFFEFFAGGGMARLGLGAGWECTFANDIDALKRDSYVANHGAANFSLGDIREVSIADLPGVADMIWGSFPCQDLSRAGAGAGLRGERSGTFYPFWDVIGALIAGGRAPKLVVLENVCGTLTSRGGRDFAAICDAFTRSGYRFGALIINANLFLAQSRPRLFIIGIRDDVRIAPGLTTKNPIPLFHPEELRRAMALVSPRARDRAVWWSLPTPPQRRGRFADLIESEPTGVKWHTPVQTSRLLALMAPLHTAKIVAAQRTGRREVGTIYRRTRVDAAGCKLQRAEVRFDDLAGCLRTPAGGSSRQTVMVVEGSRIRTRLISARETARLMGLPDDYVLPSNYNAAYRLTGDGVAAPVVRHLARYLLEPLLMGVDRDQAVA